MPAFDHPLMVRSLLMGTMIARAAGRSGSGVSAIAGFGGARRL
jgi:hypothetical protein